MLPEQIWDIRVKRCVDLKKIMMIKVTKDSQNESSRTIRAME